MVRGVSRLRTPWRTVRGVSSRRCGAAGRSWGASSGSGRRSVRQRTRGGGRRCGCGPRKPRAGWSRKGGRGRGGRAEL
eukprot:3746119-Rhodomonas_salina.1